MDTEARRTLYGGAAIGVGCYLLGLVTVSLIAVTGLALIGSTLFVSGLFNQVSKA